MTGLVLKLRPHEKLLINGAVVQNGDKAARLRVRTPGALILRLCDALHPKEAKTPLQKAYYIAQLAVAGAVDSSAAMLEALANLSLAKELPISDEELQRICAAESLVEKGELFPAMRLLKKAVLPPRTQVQNRIADEDACFSPRSL